MGRRGKIGRMGRRGWKERRQGLRRKSRLASLATQRWQSPDGKVELRSPFVPFQLLPQDLEVAARGWTQQTDRPLGALDLHFIACPQLVARLPVECDI